MRQRLTAILKNLAILLLVGGLVWGVYYILVMNIIDRKVPRAEDNIIVHNMRIRVWKNEKVKWEVRARTVIMGPDRNYYNITDIYEGTFYSDKKVYKFTSPGGTYDVNLKKVNLTGKTIFRATAGGDYFKANLMWWDGEIERFMMSGGVEASSEGTVFKGKQLIAMGEKMDNYTVSGGVSVYIPDVHKSETIAKDIIESGLKKSGVKQVTLSAERVEYNTAAKTMKCYAQELPNLAGVPPIAAPGQGVIQNAPREAPVEPFPLPDLRLPLPQGNVGMLPMMPPTVAPPQLAPPGQPAQAPRGPMPPGINVPGQLAGAPQPGAANAQQPPGIVPPGTLQPPPPAQRPEKTVAFHARKFDLEAQELFVDNGQGKYARASGFVKIVRKGSRPDKNRSNTVRAIQKNTTTIESAQAEYFWKEGRVSINSFLTMKQKSMDVAAGSGTLLTKEDKAQLRSGVTLHQPDGKWLFKEKIIAKDASDETKDAAKEETTVFSNSLDLDFNSEDISAAGNISVIQKKRNLTASNATYNGKTGVWQVYGGVKANNKGDMFDAPMVEYNEKTKEIFALSGGGATVKPRDDDRKELREFFSDRDSDDFDETAFKKEMTKVAGKRLYYNEKTDVLKADGAAKLLFKDVALNGDHIIVNYAGKKAHGKGSVVIRDRYTIITGDWVDANWASHTFTVGGALVSVSYIGRAATAKKEKTDPFDLACTRLDYNSETRQGVANGAPVLISKGRKASADSIEFNLKTERYHFIGNVRMRQENGDWLRDKDYIDSDDSQSWYLAEKPTDIKCNDGVFYTDEDHFILTGNVNVDQKEKNIKADSLEFFGKDKRLLLDGNVVMSQTGGEWLFEGGFIEDDEDEDVKKRARDVIKITAPHVESLYGEKRLHMVGGVVITQGKSRAEGDTLWYYGKDKLTVIEGNVMFKDEDDRVINAKRIVYNGKTKAVEAFKAIKGDGYVNKKK